MGGEVRDVGSMRPERVVLRGSDGSPRRAVRVPLREEYDVPEGES